MTELVVYKTESGQIAGLGEKGRRAWEKFCRILAELAVGETMKFSYNLPRSPRHHRYFFAKMTGLLERQERFENLHDLLEWLKVGAGHVDFMPGALGEVIAMPRSIAWINLEEQEFIEFHREATDFLWTPHAMAYLWSHLPPEHRYQCIEHWHRDYERTSPPMKRTQPVKPEEAVPA